MFPSLNTSSTSYDTPGQQIFLRKKAASSTRLSAIPSQVSQSERTGEPAGSLVSGFEKCPRQSKPDREAEGPGKRTLDASPDGFTTEQLQVLLDTLAARQRTKERLMDQVDASLEPNCCDKLIK